MWYVCTFMFPIFLSQCISEIGHQELYDGLLFPSMPDGVYIPTQQSRLWHFGKNFSGWCSATAKACMIAMVLVGFVLKYKLFTGRRSYWYIFSVRFDWTKILPNLCKVRSFHRYVFSYWNFDVIFGKFVSDNCLSYKKIYNVYDGELFLMQVLELKCYVLLHSMLFQCTNLIHVMYDYEFRINGSLLNYVLKIFIDILLCNICIYSEGSLIKWKKIYYKYYIDT